MRYIQRLNKGANKYNEIYTKAQQRVQTNIMRYIQNKQRCKQIQ